MEDIISMDALSINLLILGIAICAIVLAAYYGIDGFNNAVLKVNPKSQSDCPNGATYLKGPPGGNSVCAICVHQSNGETKCRIPEGSDVPKVVPVEKPDDSKKNASYPPDDESFNKILDNRIKSCKKLMERSFERPERMDYEKGATRGCDSSKVYNVRDKEEEQDVCEGFSPLL